MREGMHQGPRASTASAGKHLVAEVPQGRRRGNAGRAWATGSRSFKVECRLEVAGEDRGLAGIRSRRPACWHGIHGSVAGVTGSSSVGRGRRAMEAPAPARCGSGAPAMWRWWRKEEGMPEVEVLLDLEMGRRWGKGGDAADGGGAALERRGRGSSDPSAGVHTRRWRLWDAVSGSCGRRAAPGRESASVGQRWLWAAL
ncbi:hypothetical protein VPH35_037356 [Triticum aestivum]